MKIAEDDDGNQLSAGVYTVYDSSIEDRVYSIKDKPIQFRPFINSYQYMEYDPNNNNYPCSSVIFKSWKDEPIDTNGGVVTIPFAVEVIESNCSFNSTIVGRDTDFGLSF